MRLQIEELGVKRGEEMILSALSFTVSGGQALIVRGANGAGKSTLLRAIAGLLPHESGHVSIENPDPEFADSTVPELCHYLGGDNAMKPAMSVAENLQFWQEFSGHPHLDIDDALDMVGLDGLQSVPFGHLSTGQRRRIGIARLLVSYRPIWILDEPVSGLDAASEAQFAALMQVHLEDGGLIVAATHVPLGLDNAAVLTLDQNSVELDQ
ncbi:MAG: heme ABC exporter ATP-binding protein CcmA [Rhizobiaceae bacterium]